MHAMGHVTTHPAEFRSQSLVFPPVRVGHIDTTVVARSTCPVFHAPAYAKGVSTQTPQCGDRETVCDLPGSPPSSLDRASPGCHQAGKSLCRGTSSARSMSRTLVRHFSSTM